MRLPVGKEERDSHQTTKPDWRLNLKIKFENGIATISTNFEAMGKILAQMILKRTKEQIENKSALIIRNSL